MTPNKLITWLRNRREVCLTKSREAEHLNVRINHGARASVYAQVIDFIKKHPLQAPESTQLVDALEIYLVAGSKESRREASVIAKQAIKNFKEQNQ